MAMEYLLTDKGINTKESGNTRSSMGRGLKNFQTGKYTLGTTGMVSRTGMENTFGKTVLLTKATSLKDLSMVKGNGYNL